MEPRTYLFLPPFFLSISKNIIEKNLVRYNIYITLSHTLPTSFNYNNNNNNNSNNISTRATEVRLDGWCEGGVRQQRNDGGGCATMRERSERVESPGTYVTELV